MCQRTNPGQTRRGGEHNGGVEVLNTGARRRSASARCRRAPLVEDRHSVGVKISPLPSFSTWVSKLTLKTREGVSALRERGLNVIWGEMFLMFVYCTGSLDKALSAIDTLGIGNFDGQGSIAPEKAEIQAEVVGTATLKENLWFVRQQREVLKTR